MNTKLFEPITFKNMTLKNRIVMSPMCMYSCFKQDGQVTPFHITHYESRAAGQAGLVMLEASAVLPEGRISPEDLGIWSDDQIEGLKYVNDRIHAHDSKSGIQLAHAGRKAMVDGEIYAPSAIPFKEDMKTPTEMTDEDINRTIQAFKEAARRAKEANFDMVEIHGAHGYLINEFLSPLTNKRTDYYGGSRENRYRFLSEIIESVKTEFDGPIFVRISAAEYHDEGNNIDDFIYFSKQMKQQGIELIDCSSGGVVAVPIKTFPGYQVTYAETIKHEADIPTGAVGQITTGIQAEEILQNHRADLIFVARAFLSNPYWPKQVADELGYDLEGPKHYTRGW
ncbi:NADPH dehydrogenase NamA [Filobacillus milosensis]|uniref:NADPH dehydrogenase NamA n=1 Tax=Filobacillus milosensis TaxID=94137 RepID=A0A4Y8ISI8_9BACI|nr:NADPH dehydrogenase NamA [Filobacillus milosensis]TFB23893.1 NADPH dehydrogenase NamA [Filobacillus milosensis]